MEGAFHSTKTLEVQEWVGMVRKFVGKGALSIRPLNEV